MFSFTSAMIFGSFKFENRSSHSISMIFSWLNEHVRQTLTSKFKPGRPLPSSDPRENLFHNIAQSHFVFDVRKGTLTKGLDSELNLSH